MALALLLIGLVLTGGGGWLATLGGSWYYLLAGIGLLASGGLLLRGRALGPWPLAPSVVAPTVLLVLVLVLLALPPPDRMGWARLRPRGARTFGVFIVGAAALGVAAGWRLVGPQGALAQGQEPEAPAPAEPLGATGADWPAYGGTHGGTRYSTLDAITDANVTTLTRAKEIRTGDMPDMARGDPADDAPETTPTEVGDTLHLCTAMGAALALDAATGEERWRFDPDVSTEAIPSSANCRGVSPYADPEAAEGEARAERILWGTLDARPASSPWTRRPASPARSSAKAGPSTSTRASARPSRAGTP